MKRDCMPRMDGDLGVEQAGSGAPGLTPTRSFPETESSTVHSDGDSTHRGTWMKLRSCRSMDSDMDMAGRSIILTSAITFMAGERIHHTLQARTIRTESITDRDRPEWDSTQGIAWLARAAAPLPPECTPITAVADAADSATEGSAMVADSATAVDSVADMAEWAAVADMAAGSQGRTCGTFAHPAGEPFAIVLVPPERVRPVSFLPA